MAKSECFSVNTKQEIQRFELQSHLTDTTKQFPLGEGGQGD